MEDKVYLIRVSKWCNAQQCYESVGTLICDAGIPDEVMFIGFIYDQEWRKGKREPLDPARLVITDDNQGAFVYNRAINNIFPYFAQFLPGEFANRLINSVNPKWNELHDGIKLCVMTEAYGDHGAIQLNPQNDQYNHPIRDIEKLDELVVAIRKFQNEGRLEGVTKGIYGSLCSLSGTKPKIEFEEFQNGIGRRVVAKLNSSGIYNDARVSVVMESVQKSAGINTCDSRVVQLPESNEDVLFSFNYARSERYINKTSSSQEKLLLKYNRISFATLLAEDPYLKIGENPSYKHAVHVIKKYSDDSESDLHELFRRCMYAMTANHTSNGLKNLEMYEAKKGKWRLSPGFNNLPNPLPSTQYELEIGGGVTRKNEIRLESEFIQSLGKEFGLDSDTSLKLAYEVCVAVSNYKKHAVRYNLSEQDVHVLDGAINQSELEKCAEEISDKLNVTGINVVHSSEQNVARGMSM